MPRDAGGSDSILVVAAILSFVVVVVVAELRGFEGTDDLAEVREGGGGGISPVELSASLSSLLDQAESSDKALLWSSPASVELCGLSSRFFSCRRGGGASTAVEVPTLVR